METVWGLKNEGTAARVYCYPSVRAYPSGRAYVKRLRHMAIPSRVSVRIMIRASVRITVSSNHSQYGQDAYMC